MKWQSLFTDHEINHWSTKTIVLKQWGGRDLATLTCCFMLIHRVHIFQAHADLLLFFAVLWPSLVLRVFSPTYSFKQVVTKSMYNDVFENFTSIEQEFISSLIPLFLFSINTAHCPKNLLKRFLHVLFYKRTKAHTCS